MIEGLSISVCVPAFNEEKTIKEAVEDLQKNISPRIQRLEIIIVDDSSTDSTFQLAEKMSKEYPNVKLIRHNRNLGVGACFRDSLAVASCDYITWFPADGENSAEQFILSLSYLSKDTVVVYHHRGRDNRFFLRRLISKIYTKIINGHFNLNLKYYNDLTVFPTWLLRSFPSVANSSVIWAENLIRVIKHGYKVIELSAPLKKRKSSKSKVFTIPSMINIIKDIFYILFKVNIENI